MRIKLKTADLKKFYDPFRDGVTQSILIGWLKCREYARLNSLGWTQNQPTGPLQFGDLAHGVLEAVYKAVQAGNAVLPTREEIRALLEVQATRWQKEDGQMASERSRQQLEDNLAILEATLPSYFQKWWIEDTVKSKWKGLEQEFTFPIITPRGKVMGRGKMDGVTEVNGLIGLFETKTKGQIKPNELEEQLLGDFQTQFYALAVRHKYGKYPTWVRYNIIRRSQKKPKKGEPLKVFIDRLEGEISAEKSYNFIRYKIDKPISEIKKFEADLIILVNDFLGWWMGELPNYKNPHSCVDKYGRCAMSQICYANDHSNHFKREKVFPELSYGEKK